MKTLDEFRRFYETELRAELEELEARRKGIVHKFLWTALVLAALVAGTFLAGLWVSEAPVAAVVFLVVSAIILGITWYVLTRNFAPDFKRRIIGRIVRFIDESLQYSPERCVSQSDFLASRIFLSRIDRYSGEDHVSGRLGRTAVEFSELHAEYKTTTHTKRGTQTHWHTIFKGLFFIADFNKSFRSVTVVLPDLAEKALGWIGQKLQEWNVTRPGELVKLEDPEFEREFVVYSDDQVESRYILSSSLMRRILDFRRRAGCDASLSFAGSRVYVAISTGKNLFEPSYFSSLLDFKVAREYLEQLELATGIVEELDLNTRIWTKE
jgi:hypothetical protein